LGKLFQTAEMSIKQFYKFFLGKRLGECVEASIRGRQRMSAAEIVCMLTRVFLEVFLYARFCTKQMSALAYLIYSSVQAVVNLKQTLYSKCYNKFHRP